MLNLDQLEELKNERLKNRPWKPHEVPINMTIGTDDGKNFTTIKSIYTDKNKIIAELGGNIFYNGELCNKVSIIDLHKDFIGMHPNGLIICGMPDDSGIITP